MQMEYINTWENKLFLSLPGTGVGGGWRLVGGLSAKILVQHYGAANALATLRKEMKYIRETRNTKSI